MKIEGAGSGTISQRHGSADPDPDPDPHQNVMDPQHWILQKLRCFIFNTSQISDSPCAVLVQFYPALCWPILHTGNKTKVTNRGLPEGDTKFLK
jgi:hypothetical protein